MQVSLIEAQTRLKRIARPIVEGEFGIRTPWDIVRDQRNSRYHFQVSGKDSINVAIDASGSDEAIAETIRVLLKKRKR